jgi:hypothetical protein
MELGRSRRTLMMMLLRLPAARFSYRVISQHAALKLRQFNSECVTVEFVEPKNTHGL